MAKWDFQKSGNYKRKGNPNYRGGREVPCAFCGKLVYRTPSGLKRSKNLFCSTDCHDAFRRKPRSRTPAAEMRGPKHQRWAGPRYCKICGTELLDRMKRKKLICSETCSIEARRRGRIAGKIKQLGSDGGWTTFTCEYCGRSFRIVKSVAVRRSFCSRACVAASGIRTKYKRPTKLEIAVSEALKSAGFEFVSQHSPAGAPGVYDFYVESLNLLIEADGIFWHHSKWAEANLNIKARDKRKTDWAESNGFRLLRIDEMDVLKNGAQNVLVEKLAKV